VVKAERLSTERVHDQARLKSRRQDPIDTLERTSCRRIFSYDELQLAQMTTLPISPTAKKRLRSPPDDPDSAKAVSPPQSASSSSAVSSFRNVSACNRCRLRKNRCDQRLPACTACEKAHVKCVGYDPITKREIPRRSAQTQPRLITTLVSPLALSGLTQKPSAMSFT
jgi:hypothetical protein